MVLGCCGGGLEEVDVGSSFLLLFHGEDESFHLLLVHGEDSMWRERKKERNRVFLIGKPNKAKSTQIRNLRQDSLMNFLYLGIRRSFLDWIDLNWSMMAFSLENTPYYLRISSVGNFRFSGNHSSSKAWVLILGNFALLERLVLFQNL